MALTLTRVGSGVAKSRRNFTPDRVLILEAIREIESSQRNPGKALANNEEEEVKDNKISAKCRNFFVK